MTPNKHSNTRDVRTRSTAIMSGPMAINNNDSQTTRRIRGTLHEVIQQPPHLHLPKPKTQWEFAIDVLTWRRAWWGGPWGYRTLTIPYYKDLADRREKTETIQSDVQSIIVPFLRRHLYCKEGLKNKQNTSASTCWILYVRFQRCICITDMRNASFCWEGHVKLPKKIT